MLALRGKSGKLGSTMTPLGPNVAFAALTSAACGPRGTPRIAPSSKGKTTDSDSVNRGSNPRGASISFIE